jgi:hypothetical protein
LLAFLAIIAIPHGAEAAPVAGEKQGEQHCVVKVIGLKGDVLVTGPATCFETEAQAAQSYLGGASAFPGKSLASPAAVSLAASTVIGRHYTGSNYTGSSMTITGSQCLGGVWYPTGSWNNNIASSRHYCGGRPTTFYDASDCKTSAYSIYNDSSGLGWMDNKASCVRYG